MKNTLITVLCLFAFFALTSTKCNKDNPPKAVVNAVDVQGKPLIGAKVKIYSDPTYYNNGVGYPSVGYYNPDERTLYDVQYTDGNGQSKHSFKYESIYSVKVIYVKSIYHPGPHADTTYIIGDGALILKNDKTYSETVNCITEVHTYPY
jgi:hypothetical protein